MVAKATKIEYTKKVVAKETKCRRRLMREIIGRNISILYRNEQRFADVRLKAYGLNKVQAEVLLQLSEEVGLNQTDLNKFFLFNKATITKITTHLEQENYLSRKVCEKDRREKELYLTPKGKEILPIIKNVLGQWQELLTKNIRDDEIHLIKSQLAQMVDNITRMKEE